MHEKTAWDLRQKGRRAGRLGLLARMGLATGVHTSLLGPIGLVTGPARIGSLLGVHALAQKAYRGIRGRPSFGQAVRTLAKEKPHSVARVLLPPVHFFKHYQHKAAMDAVKRGLLKGLGVGVGGLGALAAVKALKKHREKVRRTLERAQPGVEAASEVASDVGQRVVENAMQRSAG